MPTLLVVDDEPGIRKMLTEYLSQEGYRVETAANGRDALIVARNVKPDLVLLDVMMPEINGFDFLRHYRREFETPVILLTARVDESDKIVGLELGGDDYVTKPFSLKELGARVRAVLRRSTTHDAHRPAETLSVAGVTLDRARHRVEVDNQEVDLTPTEFQLLATLMGAAGRVFDRATLLEAIGGFSIEGVERTIDVHIRNLRSKIEPDPREPRYIETVFGVGYRFAEG